MPRQTVAAVIPTKNVAGMIRPTLESLRFCDEIVIVDMFSTDDTRQICESYPNVRFVQREDYIYGNFNFGVEQAQSQWIIRIDSDEVISPQLHRSIEAVLNDPEPNHDHYEAECHLYLFGMRLRHGYGDCRRTFLFRKGHARYRVESEHEGLSASGPAGRLEGHYDHFSTPSLSDWMTKYNYYTDRDAERLSRPPMPRWRALWHAMNHFRGSYFGRGRLYRDGYLGFVVAAMAAFAQMLLEFKLWQRREQARLGEAGLLPDHPNARASRSISGVQR